MVIESGYRRFKGENAARPYRRPFPRWMLAAAFLVLTMAIVALVAGSFAPAVFETWAYAALVLPLLISAGMLGLALTERFARDELFNASPWPHMYRAVLSTALGLGAYGLAILGLGALHLLHPYWLPLLLPLAGAAISIAPSRKFFRAFDWTPCNAGAGGWGGAEWFLLLAALPLAMALIAATFPPGTLWSSEGNGYDVLEYHLQMPREYALANSIMPVAHNVYSYLPANVEMLYLLLANAARSLMGEVGSLGHLWGVFPSQFLHVAFMLLTVMAIGLAPLRLRAAGRAVAMLLTLSIPWTIITASLAYDEWGMMLFGSLALGLAMRTTDSPRKTPCRRSEGILIGALLGLAMGCKLTAGIAFALPIACVMLMRHNPKCLLSAILMATALYLPWAARAAIASGGNPIFPLAANALGRDGWTPDQVQRFNHGHAALENQQSLAGRASALVNESLLDEQWSPGWSSVYQWAGGQPPSRAFWWKHLGILWIAVAIGLAHALFAKRSRQALFLLIVIALQVIAWMFLTQLQSRFLLPVIVPLAILMGMAAERDPSPPLWSGMIRIILCAAVGAQALCAIFLLLPQAGLLAGAHVMADQKSRRPIPPPIGELFARSLNIALMTAHPDAPTTSPPPQKVLLIGDAAPLFWEGDLRYNTVFDRNPLADVLRAGGPDAAARWLRAEDFDYVIINWFEIRRLRATYGFDAAITPAAIDALIRPGIASVSPETGWTVLHITSP